MKIYYFCKSCKKENSFTTKATDRLALKEEHGLTISEPCKSCGTITERHINRLHAKPRVQIILASVGLSLILAVFLLGLGWIVSLVFSIPIIAWKHEDDRARRFNNILVSDKTA